MLSTIPHLIVSALMGGLSGVIFLYLLVATIGGIFQLNLGKGRISWLLCIFFSIVALTAYFLLGSVLLLQVAKLGSNQQVSTMVYLLSDILAIVSTLIILARMKSAH